MAACNHEKKTAKIVEGRGSITFNSKHSRLDFVRSEPNPCS